MPQNKPMKIQWITVNGRQVPLVLPQTYSYADDDWKVTSDQDPLPVVEYGTTEGGVIVPKRVSGEGHELTQLTGSFITNDKPIPIKEQKPIGSKEILILKSATERGSSIPASTEDVIYEHIGSTIIDTLEFAVGNKMNVLLRIYRRNGENWERISLLVNDGAGRTYFSAENILRYGSSFFKVLVYDDSQNKYKFALSSPLAFAEGVKISLENVDSENNHHGGIFIKGREF